MGEGTDHIRQQGDRAALPSAGYPLRDLASLGEEMPARSDNPVSASRSIAAFAGIREAGSEAVSSDGAFFAWLSNRSGTNQIWMKPALGGAAWRVTDMPERVVSFAFNPKSNDILFVTDCGGDERYRFWLLRDGDGEPVALTGDPATVHIWGAWSPDGTRVAYTANPRDRRCMDVFLADIASGATVCLHEGRGYAEIVAFTADGAGLIVRDAERSISDQDLYLLDIATRRRSPLAPHDGRVRYVSVKTRKDGTGLFLLCDQGGDFHALRDCRYDGRPLADSVAVEGCDIDAFALSPDQTEAAVVVNRDGASALALADLATGARAPVELPFPGVVNSLRYTPDGAALLMSIHGATHPCDVWRCDVASRRFARLTDEPKGGIAPETMIEPELARFASFDGTEIPCLVYRPRAAAPKAGYPVLFVVHGGPESQWQPHWRADVQYHLDQGIMVVAPNVRGSTGYGRPYHEADDHGKRMDSVADLHAVRLAVGEWPEVDAARIAIQGQSYGGFMVLAALTGRPDLWKAGVDLYGISNFTTMMLTTGPWRRTLRAAEYGDPGTMADLLTEISPIRRIADVRAPLLLVHCFEDPRVPMEQSEQVYSALRGLGRAVEILRIAHEGHGFARRENRIKAYGAIADFLVRHL